MGSLILSAQFVRLLDERLREVGENEFNELKSMIPMLFRMLGSEKAWEEFYSVGAVPDIPLFNGKMSALGIAPGYHTKIEPKEYGGKIDVERKLIDDKKYGVLDDMAGGLMRSAHRVREKRGVRAFAYAFSSAFDYQVSEEGQPLCSSSHTTKSGTSTTNGFDNAGTSSLNKTSVAATRLLMRQFRNDISERIDIGDELALILPDNLVETAWEINNTKEGYDTAGKDANYQYKRYEIIPYLRLDDYDTNNWFMVDKRSMKRDLIFIDRVLPEIETLVDFHTKMLMISIYFRCAYGWKDWRWVYGHQVS